mmetsp:Transcript_26058/g.75482  ORF Transcript_26058/g.75482 Transcript_26058/m.75482 type:complete len:221 (+) Transcript_26058:149-811(+)
MSPLTAASVTLSQPASFAMKEPLPSLKEPRTPPSPPAPPSPSTSGLLRLRISLARGASLLLEPSGASHSARSMADQSTDAKKEWRCISSMPLVQLRRWVGLMARNCSTHCLQSSETCTVPHCGRWSFFLKVFGSEEMSSGPLTQARGDLPRSISQRTIPTPHQSVDGPYTTRFRSTSGASMCGVPQRACRRFVRCVARPKSASLTWPELETSRFSSFMSR